MQTTLPGAVDVIQYGGSFWLVKRTVAIDLDRKIRLTKQMIGLL